MGQKKTWSFHHVPFTMLWESMSLDYKNNWQSIINTKMLDCYSESIFDKEYISNKFIFTWKSKFLPTKNVRNIPNQQRRDICCINKTKTNKISFKFTWIDNANRGTNESKCTKSYLIKQNNNSTILNFFFRENFNLIKLRKKNKMFVNVENELSDFKPKIKHIIPVFSKRKYTWTVQRRFRKINKKYKKLVNNLKLCYSSYFIADFRNQLKFFLNRPQINEFYLERFKHLRKFLTKKGLKKNTFKQSNEFIGPAHLKKYIYSFL